ncbi:MAG: diguanylate cyclase [Methylophaga sp.]|nr:MAG: diguanylate cyclase [Methylophaga sp.]
MSFLNLSLKQSICIAVTIYIFLVISFAYFSFSQEKKKLYTGLDQQLEMAALTAPLLLPHNLHHQDMQKDDLTRQQDYQNLLALSEFADSTDIVYIYTLILHDGKILFTSSSATEKERQSGEGLSFFFDLYEDVDPQVFEIFRTGKKQFIEYTDRWGSFRSIFIPQFSEDGTFYLAVADFSITQIQGLLNQHLYQILALATLFLLFICPIYLVVNQRIYRGAKVLEQKVQQQSIDLSINQRRLERVLHSANQAWFEINVQTENIIVSDEYHTLLNINNKETLFTIQTWKDNLHPDDMNATMAIFQQGIKSGEAIVMEYRRKTAEGKWLWLRASCKIAEWDPHKNPLLMVGVVMDISHRKRNELVLQALAESGTQAENDIFKTIVRQLALSNDMRYAFLAIVNAVHTHATTIALWADGQFIDNITYELKDTPCANVAQVGACFYPSNIQQLFPKDQMIVEMQAESYIGVPLKNTQNKVLGLIAMLDDRPMTENRQTKDLLKSLAVRASIELENRAADEKLQLSARVFSDTHEGIIITDANARIIDVNPAFSDITGYNLDDIIGQHGHLFRSDKHSPEFYDDIWQITNKQGHWQGEVWNRKKNGQSFPALYTISLLKDDAGTTLHYVILFTDITESKQQQQTLESIAHYDVLTQLPNRTLFADRFSQAIAHSNRNESMFAICFLDLDNFKPVNDGYGHDTGDQLLIEVAARIQANIREEDTVSRQGGDEFTLLLRDIESFTHCELMIQRIHASLSQPYLIDGHSHKISTSTGITMFPLDDSDLDTLLRHADQAMYQAKLSGKNHYRLYNALDDQQTIHKLSRLQEIQQALINNEFCLYYQPKINMKTGDVFGAEALIRWQHPEKGLVPPFDFLPDIENTDLEIQVGNWVINEALAQLNTWRKQDIMFEVSVNISSHHLQSPTFHDELNTALAKYPKVKSKYFQLEILESSALGDLTTISNIVKSCRHTLGVNIALDDFGTGYSSLTHLRNLPAQTIKIDRSFVKDILDDPNDYTLIKGVIGLAHSFNRNVIAEGVETTEHGLMLLTLGCEQAQGFGIARPMPADDIKPWLLNYSPNLEWIAYASKKKSIQDRRIKLFKLVSTQWITAFHNNIQSSPEDVESWPIMTQTKCHCGHWIKRAKRKQWFTSTLMDQIESSHQTMHQSALDLLMIYQAGEIDVAQTGLIEVQRAFEDMNIILKKNEAAF